MISRGVSSGLLSFSDDPVVALGGADVIWVAIDTPVDDSDVADAESVLTSLQELFSFMSPSPLVIVSSQLPIGSTRKLAAAYLQTTGDSQADFVCVPENLRLGLAIERFLKPDRVVVGADSERSEQRALRFLSHIDAPIVTMSTVAAEATKHAINSFLATSVAFANEIGLVCRLNGVDPREVEEGLKTDERIGRRAYVRAGEGFAGGTLGRDIRYLGMYGDQLDGGLPLLAAVRESNSHYLRWPLRALVHLNESGMIDFESASIVILGLTYKSSTNTLRRSSSVEFGRELVARGVSVRGYTPTALAEEDDLGFDLVIGGVDEALRGADVAIVMTDVVDVTSLCAGDYVSLMRTPIVIDYGRFVSDDVRRDGRITVIDSEIIQTIEKIH